MKKTLVIAAIILAVGISAAITANRYWAAGDHKAPVKTTGGCCPAEKPADDASALKDGASCPYMAGKAGHTATKPHMPISKPVPTVKAKPTPAKPAKPAPTAAVTKPATEVSQAPQPVEKQVESAVCPVMKSRIADVSKAAGHSEYNGKTYYFCCAGCKPLFDKDPAKYVGQ